MQALLVLATAGVYGQTMPPPGGSGGSGSGVGDSGSGIDRVFPTGPPQSYLTCQRIRRGCEAIANENTCEQTQGCIYMDRGCRNATRGGGGGRLGPGGLGSGSGSSDEPEFPETTCSGMGYETAATCNNNATCVWQDDGSFGYCDDKPCGDYDEVACNASQRCEYNSRSEMCMMSSDLGDDGNAPGNDPCMGAEQAACGQGELSACLWEGDEGSGTSVMGYCRSPSCEDFSTELVCPSERCEWSSIDERCFPASMVEDDSVGDDVPDDDLITDTCMGAEQVACGQLSGCVWDSIDDGSGTSTGSWCRQLSCIDYETAQTCPADGCQWNTVDDMCTGSTAVIDDDEVVNEQDTCNQADAPANCDTSTDSDGNSYDCVWEDPECRRKRCDDYTTNATCNANEECLYDDMNSFCMDAPICGGPDDGPGSSGSGNAGSGDIDGCFSAITEDACDAGTGCEWTAIPVGPGGSGSGVDGPVGSGGSGSEQPPTDPCAGSNAEPTFYCAGPGAGSGDPSGPVGCMSLSEADCTASEICGWQSDGGMPGSGTAMGFCAEVVCQMLDNDADCNAFNNDACVWQNGMCRENSVFYRADRSPCFTIRGETACAAGDGCLWDTSSARGKCRGPCTSQFASGSCSAGCLSPSRVMDGSMETDDGLINDDGQEWNEPMDVRCIAESDARCGLFDEGGCPTERCEVRETQFDCPFSQCGRGSPCSNDHVCSTSDMGIHDPLCCTGIQVYCALESDPACFGAAAELLARINCTTLVKSGEYGSGDEGSGSSGMNDGTGDNDYEGARCFGIYDEGACNATANCTYRTFVGGSGETDTTTGYCDEMYCADYSGFNEAQCESMACVYNNTNGQCKEPDFDPNGSGNGSPGSGGQSGSGLINSSGDDEGPTCFTKIGQAECDAVDGCMYIPADYDDVNTTLMISEDYCSSPQCYVFSTMSACNDNTYNLDCTWSSDPEFPDAAYCDVEGTGMGSGDGSHGSGGGSGTFDDDMYPDEHGCVFNAERAVCLNNRNCSFLVESFDAGDGTEYNEICVVTSCWTSTDESACEASNLNCVWMETACAPADPVGSGDAGSGDHGSGSSGMSGDGPGMSGDGPGMSGDGPGMSDCNDFAVTSEATCLAQGGDCTWYADDRSGSGTGDTGGYCDEVRCDFFLNASGCDAHDGCAWESFGMGSGAGSGSDLPPASGMPTSSDDGFCNFELDYDEAQQTDDISSGSGPEANPCSTMLETECTEGCDWSTDGEGYSYCSVASCFSKVSGAECSGFSGGNCTWLADEYVNHGGSCVESNGYDLPDDIRGVNVSLTDIVCENYRDRARCGSREFCMWLEGGPGCKTLDPQCSVADEIQCIEYDQLDSCNFADGCSFLLDESSWSYRCDVTPLPPVPTVPPVNRICTVDGEIFTTRRLFRPTTVYLGRQGEFSCGEVHSIGTSTGATIAQIRNVLTSNCCGRPSTRPTAAPIGAPTTPPTTPPPTTSAPNTADPTASAAPTAPPTPPPTPPPTFFLGGVEPSSPPTTSAPSTATPDVNNGGDVAGSAGSDDDAKDVETNMMIIIIVCAMLGAGVLLFAIARKTKRDPGAGRAASHQNPIYAKGIPAAGPGPVGEKDKAKGLVRVESMC